MRVWHILRSRLQSSLFRDRRERDLSEELQLHIEREIERRVAEGVPEHEARHQALRMFGSVESLKEECRDARGVALVDHLRRDTQHAARRLLRDWRFTASAVLILGLGIGANTAIFSVVNATIFRQSAFANPDRLVEIYQNSPDGGQGINSYPAFLDMAEYSNVFAETTAVSVPIPVTYLDRGAVRSGVVEYTTPSYLAVLGLQPSRGRWFDATEDRPGTDSVAVISHQAWTTRFAADPSVIGRTIRMQGVPVTIVGVGPVGHNATLNIGLVTDFWLPISALPALLDVSPRAPERRPGDGGFFVKARLNDGVTVAQAQAAMDILGRRLATEYPNEDPGKGISVFASTDVRIHPQMDMLLTAVASLLLGVVGLVLAIACSNLATLLLVRAAARAKEVSVRLAVGATRWQLIRHLLTESVLLSVTGGVVGCVLAWWIIRSLGAIDLPIAVDFSLDYRVLAFALGLSLVTGVIFGLAPAFKATRVDLVTALRDGGQTRSAEHRWLTLKNALVVFQVAVSAVLLAGTSVFLQMVNVASAQRTGFAVDGVAMVETDARYAGYSGVRATNLYEELRRRVAATPGVQSTALTRGQPMEVNSIPVVVEGATAGGPALVVGGIWAGPGFFETLQIPILFGRAIDGRDREGAPLAAVISETMARQHFGGVNAVGRRFRIDQDPNWIEVVGVARDTGTSDLGDLFDPIPHLVFRPPAQSGLSPNTVVARTSLDATGLVGSMQRELRALDSALPVFAAETMGQRLERSLMAPRAVAAFLGGLGAVGLSLAGIGLYAVIAFAVSRRAREIGIRMALGARSQQVVWSVARDVAVLIGAGTGVGMVLSVLLILAMRGFSNPAPGVGNIVIYSPTYDPLGLLAIAAFIAMVGMAAAFMPARRAARMDPLIALRRD